MLLKEEAQHARHDDKYHTVLDRSGEDRALLAGQACAGCAYSDTLRGDHLADARAAGIGRHKPGRIRADRSRGLSLHGSEEDAGGSTAAGDKAAESSNQRGDEREVLAGSSYQEVARTLMIVTIVLTLFLTVLPNTLISVLTEAPWISPPITAEMMMITPGVLTQAKVSLESGFPR